MPKFRIPRRDGWENIMEPLVKQITGAQQADVRGGCHFESDMLFMQPYLVGNCHCTYGQALHKFKQENNHSVQCFHTFYQEIDDVFKKHPKYYQTNKLRAERVNMIRQLCVKNHIKYDPKNVHKFCTCPFNKKWKALNIQHDLDCPKVLPQFWYKPKDIKIWWYRIFFRDSYCNRKINKDEFKEIVNICLNHVNLLAKETFEE
jgi:hypothetical protein